MNLAAFQVRAAMRLSIPTDDAGTIVTAGTGSGKTIAFYLPGMMRIGEAIGADHWVKALAIYPRIELLKDQFAEAFGMARAIDGPLAAHGRRPLKIGALFGATPTRASRQELVEREWHRRGQDFVCPWMRCPICHGELLWRDADLAAGIERLACARSDCTGGASDDHIILTRGSLQRQPPDILFTTAEILNQRLSDHWMRGLFGVGLAEAKKPFLALLDEVHTYEGTTGAQAALTLRRWRHLLAAPLSWVGLSATLGDAARFFAELTGAHPDRVVEITPSLDEYEEQGAEYQALLRGTPRHGPPCSPPPFKRRCLCRASLILRARMMPQAHSDAARFFLPTISTSPIVSMTICATRRRLRSSASPIPSANRWPISAGPVPMLQHAT